MKPDFLIATLDVRLQISKQKWLFNLEFSIKPSIKYKDKDIFRYGRAPHIYFLYALT